MYTPLTQKSIQEFTSSNNDSERILLEGVASTTNKDLTGEIISPEAMKSMIKQAHGVNIHGDHKYGLDNVIGAVKEVNTTDDGFTVKFLVTKKHTPIVRDMLETGVNLGLSVGGFIPDYDYTKKMIKSINLTEISLTAMPANRDTMGTVHEDKTGVTKSNCLTGACHYIMKSLEEKNNMTNTNEEQTNTKEVNDENIVFTKEDASDLFNELMAEKEQNLVETITDNIKNEMSSYINEVVTEALEQGKNNHTENDNEENSEESKDKENKDELKKSLFNDLNKSIDSKFDDFTKKFFKTLESDRQPESHVKKALHEKNNTKNNGYTTKSIAEKLAKDNARLSVINTFKE